MSDPILGANGSRASLFTPKEVELLMHVEFERAQRYQYAVSCLVFEVDRLEHLHTMHGYESRSEVLQRVLDLVKETTRTGDLLGYVEEGRLLCVLPHTGAQSARGLCDRLLGRARNLVFQTGETSVRVTLSVGLSHNEHQGDIRFQTLRRVALEGLAVAQAAGGDRWAETELYGLYEGPNGRSDEAGGHTGEGPGGEVGLANGGVYRQRLLEMLEADGSLEVEEAVSRLVEELLDHALVEARADLESEQEGAKASSVGEAPSLDEKEAAYQREIDLLRRRVSKLTKSLGLTEQELGRLQRLQNLDPGLASVYRDVQGLSMDDARAELKKELMASIFEANLDLQNKRRSG